VLAIIVAMVRYIPDTTKAHGDASFWRFSSHRPTPLSKLSMADCCRRHRRFTSHEYRSSAVARRPPRVAATPMSTIRRACCGSAKVEVVALAQTAASLSSDDFDDRITKRISEAAGVPAITSARAIGLAVRALGARRIALITPFPIPVLKRLVSHYTGKYGLEVVASESFSDSDSVLYPALGQEFGTRCHRADRSTGD
jgi:hypothetical protein